MALTQLPDITLYPIVVTAKRSPATRFIYPSNTGNGGAPFILFTRHKPVYDGQATDTKQKQSTAITELSSIAMYIPINLSVSDSQQYENAESGMIGNIVNAAMSGDRSMMDLLPEDFDLENPDISSMLTAAGPGLTAAASGGLAKVFGGSTFGSVLTGGGILTGASKAAQEARKSTQATMNPRQFALFKQPNMRSFSFDFRFIPESAGESDSVVNIIKEFRTAMYPELSSSGFAYTFPDAFDISFENAADMIKIPEVVCTSATVTYNPNAMSYFTQNRRPVEINLSLQFQELQPIHREMVERGY